MSKLENVRVTAGNPRGTPDSMSASHSLTSEQGYLGSSYSMNEDIYEIHDYQVHENYRRQGYGKELLKLAYRHAKLLGAKAISASDITTRESVDTLSSVFGPDGLTIEELGDYSPDDYGGARTKASMLYEIPEAEPDDDQYLRIVTESLQSINPKIDTLNKRLVALSLDMRRMKEKVNGHTWELSDAEANTYDALWMLWCTTIEERDRIEKKDDALEFGFDLKYVDEINLDEYQNILSVPDLPGRFHIPEGTDIADKKQAYFALENLPFHNLKSNIREFSRNSFTEEITGRLDFPVDRIIGVESFLSWSGRGLFIHETNPDYSLERIVQYAQIPGEEFKGASSTSSIHIVRDLDNNLWGIATTDGSHRTAAAKLRGDKYVEVSRIYIPSKSEMPIIPLRIYN